MDDSELADELAELEQEELNKRLAGAEAAPMHSPAAAAPAGKFPPALVVPHCGSLTESPFAAKSPAQRIEEDEEEAELRELQAQLAM